MNLKCLFGFHDWEARPWSWYRNYNKGIDDEDALKEAVMLSKTKTPDFIFPLIQCKRCEVVPSKIMLALLRGAFPSEFTTKDDKDE